MFPGIPRWPRPAALPTLCLLSACALQSYQPATLDPDAEAAAYMARRMDDPELQAYMLGHGHPAADWPVQRWGLTQLTLLAFYYHPDLRVARAQAAEARAQVPVAAQRLPLIASPRVEHHSRETEDSDSPWSLGFAVEIPLSGAARRDALVQRATYLAEAAELEVGSTAWRVRSRVRAALADLHAARERGALLEQDIAVRSALVGLLEKRLQAGYVGANEAAAARLGLHEAQGELSAARTAAERAQGELAAALGVPLPVVRQATLDFAQLDALPAPPEESEARSGALRNRIDMRQRLLEFAAADADVKLQVARQYPTVALRPGYLWDQGDSVWSLALDLLLPPAFGNAPAIEGARARRETAAQLALHGQSQIIAQTDAALATYRQSLAGATSLQQASATQLARSQQTQKRFDAGYADRVELTQVRLEALAVERNAQSARVEARRALGSLEDALQRPLAGGPLPVAPAPQEPQR
ncbi:MAG TPA: TolC family protein [Burkholderiales bacterium]|nr:TolC family protein [Burkholderiales bacterium]